MERDWVRCTYVGVFRRTSVVGNERKRWSKGRLVAQVSIIVSRCSSAVCVHAVMAVDAREVERWKSQGS